MWMCSKKSASPFSHIPLQEWIILKEIQLSNVVQGFMAERSDKMEAFITLPMSRVSVQQAIITVTNALLLKLDFKVGICKSNYT